MRRTSSIVYGFDCVECVERTMYSESTPSKCELEYSTTPSSLPSTGPLPATAMIECAWTPGAIGVAAIVWRTGLLGVMPNRLPEPRLLGLTLKSPALRASSAPVRTMRNGRVRNRPRNSVTGYSVR